MHIEIIHEFWTNLVQGKLSLPGYWSYILLAILVALEGPSVTILGAVIASTGVLRPGWVFVAASIGNLSADAGWYMLGYLGRFEVLTQRIGWLRKRQARVNHLEREMKQHATKILLLAKLTLSMSVPALIAAGMARVSWQRWFPIIFIGECIWTGSLVFIGFHLGAYIKQLEAGMQIVAIVGFIVFIGILLWLFKRISKSSQLDIS
jgi:membrane protein DedA with SNARE-associated domain